MAGIVATPCHRQDEVDSALAKSSRGARPARVKWLTPARSRCHTPARRSWVFSVRRAWTSVNSVRFSALISRSPGRGVKTS